MKTTIIGHVPYNLAPYLSRFLARDVNKAFAEVTGEKVNRRAGYGLEIPCVYRLYGPKAYVDKMKVITDSMMSSGLINPRRACAARVTVVVLCVCVSVCVSTTILAPLATRRLMSDTNRFSATRAGKIMWRFC